MFLTTILLKEELLAASIFIVLIVLYLWAIVITANTHKSTPLLDNILIYGILGFTILAIHILLQLYICN